MFCDFEKKVLYQSEIKINVSLKLKFDSHFKNSLALSQFNFNKPASLNNGLVLTIFNASLTTLHPQISARFSKSCPTVISCFSSGPKLKGSANSFPFINK